MRTSVLKRFVLVGLFCLCMVLRTHAQGSVTAHVTVTKSDPKQPVSAVLWLDPLDAELGKQLSWKHTGPYRMVQKSKMFSPHLLIIPAGATVTFPNNDPFFHNVFSLFEGKRFDLGLYEAGTSKDVRFEHPGVSYIFCNIHPGMSAVVITLRTPLFAVGQANGNFTIPDVPSGSYRAHLWVEGADEHMLAQWSHTIVVSSREVDAGSVEVKLPGMQQHLNEFGKAYKPDSPNY